MFFGRGFEERGRGRKGTKTAADFLSRIHQFGHYRIPSKLVRVVEEHKKWGAITSASRFGGNPIEQVFDTFAVLSNRFQVHAVKSFGTAQPKKDRTVPNHFCSDIYHAQSATNKTYFTWFSASRRTWATEYSNPS